jgi:hypothetical protein
MLQIQHFVFNFNSPSTYTRVCHSLADSLQTHAHLRAGGQKSFSVHCSFNCNFNCNLARYSAWTRAPNIPFPRTWRVRVCVWVGVRTCTCVRCV